MSRKSKIGYNLTLLVAATAGFASLPTAQALAYEIKAKIEIYDSQTKARQTVRGKMQIARNLAPEGWPVTLKTSNGKMLCRGFFSKTKAKAVHVGGGKFTGKCFGTDVVGKYRVSYQHGFMAKWEAGNSYIKIQGRNN